MRRLIAVELTRFAARRLVRWMTFLALAAITIAAIVTWAKPDSTLRYDEIKAVLQVLAVPFLMSFWLLGASFMGAEWNHRSITTLLTWEPRRPRVFVAKLTAAVIASFLAAVALQLYLCAVFYPVAATHGGFAAVDAAWWRSTLGVIGRCAALSAFSASLGFSIATAGRNTAAAFGVGFAYLAVVENLIRAWRREWSEWLIGDNIATVMVSLDFPTQRSGFEAGLVLAAYAVAAALIAGTVFKNRDVA